MARKRWGNKGGEKNEQENMPPTKAEKVFKKIEWTKQADEVLIRLYDKHERKRKPIREQIKAEHPEEFEFLAGLSSRRFDQEIGRRWRSIGAANNNKGDKKEEGESKNSSSTEIATPSEEEPVFVEDGLPTLERTDSAGDLI